MSQKISGKNLSYDTTLPPFLARLRGQAASNSDGPDPLLVRNRRHGKPRSGSQEAEDAPLVVDDEGNVVQGLKVGVDGVVTETEKEADLKDGDEGEAGLDKDAEKEEQKEKERVAGIGAGKKRKVGKIIGADVEDGENTEKKRSGDKSAKTATDGAAAVASKKKKAKKIKLSFGDDEG